MGILRRGYAFDRSQRLHVVRRNGSSPPVPLPFYGTFRLPFLLHSRTSAFLEKTASACPKGKEPSKGRCQLHAPQEYRCFFRLRRDTLCFLTLFFILTKSTGGFYGMYFLRGGNTQLLPSGSPPLPAGRGAERYSSLHRTDRTSTSRFLSPDTPPDLSLPSPQPLQKPLWPYRCPPSGRQALQSWYC